jgi:hypothetical protein
MATAKGSTVLRTVGDDHEPRAFSTYSAAAIALIGALPDTLHDRSVPVELKRRLAKGEGRAVPPRPRRPSRRARAQSSAVGERSRRPRG